MGKFGNISGGAGKRVVSSMALPSKARGAIKHVKQKDASPSVDEDFSMHSGRTNQAPGRKVNDVIAKNQDKTIKSGNATQKKYAGGKGSTKGFVESRGREFTGYR